VAVSPVAFPEPKEPLVEPLASLIRKDPGDTEAAVRTRSS
jgi:hypothetical protein